MPETLAVVTTVWGLIMALAPLLQIRVIIKNRDASGISVTWLFIMLIGFGLWMSYGIVNAQLPLVIANIVAAIVAVGLLIVVGVYRRRNIASPAPLEQP